MEGRTILASSTLNSIPTYAMQYTILPPKILKTIDKIQWDFIWGSTNTSKKFHLINWQVLTKLSRIGDWRSIKLGLKILLSYLAWPGDFFITPLLHGAKL